MSTPLQALAWPGPRAPEALRALARASGFEVRTAELPVTPTWLASAGVEAQGRWLDAAAGWLGLEVEAVDTPYAEVEALLSTAGPALLELPGGGLLVLLGRRGRALRLLAPDLAIHARPLEEVRAVLCRPVEEIRAAEVERVLDEAAVSPQRRAAVRAGLLREVLGPRPVRGCWLLRDPPGTSLRAQARRRGLYGLAGTLLFAYVGQSALLLLSWWLLGRGALRGHLDAGWMAAWALVLLVMLPLRLLATWTGGRLSIGIGTLLKQRLLAGALALEPEEIRLQGVGQLLGRVVESQVVESFAITGSLTSVSAGVQLLMALWVLLVGAGGWPHALALVAVLVATAFTFLSYFRARRGWTRERLGMTHDLVERMAGHRTRLVQEPRERWHEGEDEALAQYLARSRELDGRSVWLTAVVPGAWLVLGLLGLVRAFALGSEPAGLAVGLGGVVLAYQSLRSLTQGLTYLAGAAISWEQIRTIVRAAERVEPGSPTVARAQVPGLRPEEGARTVVEASGLSFRYASRAEPVLRDCSLRIAPRDRLLLEGPSGGGKSTLGALIAGLRVPGSGLLLVGGLDRRTLGLAGWRERVVAAPQFHENHVLTAPFAFNLLMGRGWPGSAKDFEEAEAVCRALALGDLLDRMPAGLQQMVGETGWQLSHGERSRLYIARALLQRAELIVLDESFAALDPGTLRATMDCVLERAPALLVIAHP